MTREWGFSMAGCESAMLAAVAASLDACNGHWPRYLEIGVAHGRTFATMCEAIMSERGKSFDAVALDLPDGVEEKDHYQGPTSHLDKERFKANVAPFADRVRLIQATSQRWLREEAAAWMGPFTLALIDGCHEKPCAMEDFLALERHIAPGGVVIFHDTAPWSQFDPEQTQPHRGLPLDVRGALTDLGLLNETRPGWRLLAEAGGLPAEGGRGCMVFQRDL